MENETQITFFHKLWIWAHFSLVICGLGVVGYGVSTAYYAIYPTKREQLAANVKSLLEEDAKAHGTK